ncbi:hypothetical protein TSOC_011396 [Tetrabaena socialis]|uniref:DUF676 domain-containing protein n=1 Tax=Tetrabaena socialis TaxID=47790 RepID=A0A2J7ZQT1_9CHLO|nr:hypothetical protein TSOC_011396 [Tetrabaena socialis]|eukprot:PNH02610.1 hypothetical protein TSOC_011396 [Tetrabaena socialis]
MASKGESGVSLAGRRDGPLSEPGVSLIVVQHGLWGHHRNTAYLSELLAQRLGEGAYAVSVLNSDDKHTWGKPLMCLLSQPDLLFMHALRRFKKLVLLANVYHDRPVPYCTAAIRMDNPYEHSAPVPLDPRYPSVVTTAEAVAARAKAGAAAGLPPGSAAQLGGGGRGELDSKVPGSSGAQVARVAQSPPQQQQQEPQAQAGPPPHQAPRRRLRSTYLPLLSLLCIPLFVPALLLMTYTGRAHRCRISRTAHDFSWIEKYTNGRSPGAEHGNGGGKGGGDDEGEGGDPLGGPPHDIECPSAPELPAPAAAAAPRGSGSTAGVSAAPASRTAAGALDGGDDEVVVVVSESSVLLHDGIVELPAEVHRVQEWLVEQLNTLPWHKVDVDCRDLHAHAAIIVRNPARFQHCRDALDYLVDTWEA